MSIETEHLFVEIKPLSRVFIVEEACASPPELGNEGLVLNIPLTETGENGIRNTLTKEDSKGKPHIPNAKANGKRPGDILGTTVKVAGANGKWVVASDSCLIDLEGRENDACFFPKNHVDTMAHETYYCDPLPDLALGT